MRRRNAQEEPTHGLESDYASSAKAVDDAGLVVTDAYVHKLSIRQTFNCTKTLCQTVSNLAQINGLRQLK